jgi:hypothetical protein
MPRPQKKFHFLYKTTCVVTGRYYYGIHSTNNLDDGYLGSGRRLRYSVRKYGKDKHIREILEFANDRKAIFAREAEVANLNEVAKKDCMNLSVGGQGCLMPSENKRGFANPAWCSENTELLDKWRAKGRKKALQVLEQKRETGWRAQGFTGRVHTDKTKHLIGSKISKTQLGNKNSQFGTLWMFSLEEKASKKVDTTSVEEMERRGWQVGRRLKFDDPQISDRELFKVLAEAPNIKQALIRTGLSINGSNYKRCKKLLEKLN